MGIVVTHLVRIAFLTIVFLNTSLCQRGKRQARGFFEVQRQHDDVGFESIFDGLLGMNAVRCITAGYLCTTCGKRGKIACVQPHKKSSACTIFINLVCEQRYINDHTKI